MVLTTARRQRTRRRRQKWQWMAEDERGMTLMSDCWARDGRSRTPGKRQAGCRLTCPPSPFPRSPLAAPLAVQYLGLMTIGYVLIGHLSILAIIGHVDAGRACHGQMAQYPTETTPSWPLHHHPGCKGALSVPASSRIAASPPCPLFPWSLF